MKKGPNGAIYIHVKKTAGPNAPILKGALANLVRDLLQIMNIPDPQKSSLTFKQAKRGKFSLRRTENLPPCYQTMHEIF